jgi:hypothetical protein
MEGKEVRVERRFFNVESGGDESKSIEKNFFIGRKNSASANCENS